MIGAIVCGALVMAFVIICGAIAAAVAVTDRPAIQTPPLLIIDPERPEQALNQAGQLVATPQAEQS